MLQDGSASKGGIRPGDVVLKIGTAPVTNTVQLLAAVAAIKPQAEAVVTVQRGDKVLELPVVVAQRPTQKAAARRPG